jgi:hypothetical protein
MISFLDSIKKVMPDFPPNSHVVVLNGPKQWSFMQMALRAFYQRTDIYWIFTPQMYTRGPGENAFFIICKWKDDGGVDLVMSPIKGFRSTDDGRTEPVY